MRSLRAVFFSILMILTSSSVMITASAAPSADLITYGDVLALSNKGNTIYSMDEDYFKAGMADDEAILTSTSNPFDAPITALAKSGEHLFVGLLDGMFFRLGNTAPGDELDYWAVDFEYNMPAEYGHVTSVTVSEEGGVFLTRQHPPSSGPRPSTRCPVVLTALSRWATCPRAWSTATPRSA